MQEFWKIVLRIFPCMMNGYNIAVLFVLHTWVIPADDLIYCYLFLLNQQLFKCPVWWTKRLTLTLWCWNTLIIKLIFRQINCMYYWVFSRDAAVKYRVTLVRSKSLNYNMIHKIIMLDTNANLHARNVK